MKSTPQLYFSYPLCNESQPADQDTIIDELYQSLVNDNYTIIRDRSDARYNEFFDDFTIELGKGKCIIIAISDEYLKSPGCMFDLYEIARRSNFDRYVFREKILPVMVELVDFRNAATVAGYSSFWENEYKRRNQFIKNTGKISDEQLQQFINIKLISQNFGSLAKWLKAINRRNQKLLSVEDFTAIKTAIAKYGGRKISLWRRRRRMPAFWIALAATITIVVFAANWIKEQGLGHQAVNNSKGEMIVDSLKNNHSATVLPERKNDSAVVAKDTATLIKVDSCLSQCDSKGIKGVEIFFRDPTNRKAYFAISKGRNITFKVPCYLMEPEVTVQVSFRSADTAGYRNIKLGHFAIPDMFKTQ